MNDYTEYNINLEIRKLFILYLSNQKLKKILSENNKNFNEFYIINKNWLEKYENYYNFDILSEAIDKNTTIQIY